MGNSIQRKSGANPVHQTTFATSGTRPSSSIGSPSLTPVTRGTRSTSAATTSSGLRRISGAPCPRELFLSLRPNLVSTVSTLLKTHQTPRLPRPSGMRPVWRPERYVRWVAACPDDEDAAFLELIGVVVLAGVELHNLRV